MSTVNNSNSDYNAAAYEAINSASKGAGKSSAGGGLETPELAQDRFLMLLTAQLKNQDPMNPLDNAQMTSQLAQISTVDGITKLNATMQTLLGNTTESQSLQAASLIGHAVLVPGDGLLLSNGQAIGAVDLDGVAGKVVATIRDENGLLVRTLNLGEMDDGVTNYTWDGLTNNGEQAVDGKYHVSFSIGQEGDGDGDEQSVAARAMEYAVVTSVARNSQGVSLTVGSNDQVVRLADVKQII